MARRRTLYAWALDHNVKLLDTSKLSKEARLGLEYAKEAAQQSRRRQEDYRFGEDRIAYVPSAHEAILEVGRKWGGEDVEVVNRRIQHARRKLFPPIRGRSPDISDSELYRRLKKLKGDEPEDDPLKRRTCAFPGCEAVLPKGTRRIKWFCKDNHRVAFHRLPNLEREKARRAAIGL
jgi:hypothetical protein